jgi:exopolysaccharide production protein ExoQ
VPVKVSPRANDDAPAGTSADALTPLGRPAASAREFRLVLVAGLLAELFLPIVEKYQSHEASGSTFGQIIWAVIYVAAGLRLLALRGSARRVLGRSMLLWAFVALMFFSAVWSVAPSRTFVDAIELAGTTVVGAYLASYFTLPQLLRLIAVMFGVIAVLSLALVFGAPGHGRMSYGSGAWNGIYQDKNNLGRAMSLAVMSLVVLLAGGTRRKRALFAIFVTLAACTALLAGSNSATALGDCVVVVAVGLALTACKSARFGIVARILTSLGGAAGAIAVFVFGFTPDAIFAALGRDSSLTGRTDFWPYLQQAIAERPLVGYGYDAFFGSAVGDNFLSSYVVEAGGFSPYHAHNSFLQISLDAGYIGLAVLLLILALAIFRGAIYLVRQRGSYAAWPLMIVAYLILGSFTETYFGNYNSIEWILFVAALLYPALAT